MSTYCVHCGRELTAPVHDGCDDNPRAALEPPRYCPQCARRMVVQITPSGWTAKCSRHGVTSAP